MPQSTGVKYAAADRLLSANNVAWGSPQNAREADEPDETTFTSAACVSNQSAHVHAFRNFALLAEDGGSIPAGATITSLLVEFRFQVSLSTGGLDNVTGACHGRVYLDGVHLSSADEGSLTAVTNTNVRTTGPWTTGALTWSGTLSSPQTVFSRAALAHSAGGVGLEPAITGFEHSGGGALGTATLRCAWVRVSAGWVLFADADGGGKNTVTASGTATAQVDAAGGGKTDADSGAGQTVVITKSGGGVSSPCKAGAAAKPLVNADGGATSSATGGDDGHTALATPDGGGKADADAGAGTSTVTSYAISGEARSGADDTVIPDVRVDVYRTSDHEHMGQDTTDATGEYAVAVPLTGNETETFWARFYKTGTPNQFATTDEDLELVETTVQEA